MKKLFNKIGLFFTKIWVMLQAETPKFFRNLFRVLLSIFAFAEFVYPLAVQFVNQLTVYQIVAPAWLNEGIRIIGFVSAGGAFVSQLVVKWPALTKREQEILDQKPPA